VPLVLEIPLSTLSLVLFVYIKICLFFTPVLLTESASGNTKTQSNGGSCYLIFNGCRSIYFLYGRITNGLCKDRKLSCIYAVRVNYSKELNVLAQSHWRCGNPTPEFQLIQDRCFMTSAMWCCSLWFSGKFSTKRCIPPINVWNFAINVWSLAPIF
jgi:hypothetical protein